MHSLLLLEGAVAPFLDPGAAGRVRDYFSPLYTGNQFHRLGGGGDTGPGANVISPIDLVAVSMLDVHVPASAALSILGSLSQRLTDLLTRIPTDLALETAEEQFFAAGSAADLLWHELASLPDVGRTITSKLMARKRPKLIPIFDSVIKDALLPTQTDYWVRLRNELRDDHLVARLQEIRDQSGVGDNIPLIRILDICVWMRNRKKSGEKVPFTPRGSVSHA